METLTPSNVETLNSVKNGVVVATPAGNIIIRTKMWCLHIQGNTSFFSPSSVLITMEYYSSVTGGHIKQDLRYTQKPIYFSIFTNNIWSYLLWSPVVQVNHFFSGAPRSRSSYTSPPKLWLQENQRAMVDEECHGLGIQKGYLPKTIMEIPTSLG